MAKPPAFQLYAKDIYTGTSDLSGEEFGAYVRGLAWSWDNGPLPLDPARRARVLMVERADMERIWSAIACNWVETPQGFTNERLEVQRAELEAYRLQCAEAGRKSGESRRKRTDVHTAVPTDVTTAVHTDVATDVGTERPTEPEREANSPVSGLHSALSDLRPAAKTPRGKRADPVPCEGFDVFWQAYPLKVAKSDAIAAWNKLAPNESLRDFIGAALIWQRPTLTFEKDGQIKGTYPASWLNGRRWEDERPATPVTAAKASGLSVAEVKLLARSLGPRSWASECVRFHGGACGSPENHDAQMAVAS